MSKRNRKKQEPFDEGATNGNERTSSSRSDQGTKHKRNAVWSIIGLMVVATVAIAWMLFRNTSPSMPESTLVAQSPTAVPAADTDRKGDPASGGPQIHFLEPEYDFGTIAQGSKVSHTFVVQNIGTAPLRLIKAQGT
jgi:hypothetical protein